MTQASEPEPLSVCDGCGARCCRYVATQIDRPVNKRDYDHIRWYLLHRNVHVFEDHEGNWYLEFETPCDGLDAFDRCGIYAARPDICRRHGAADAATVCEYRSPESPYRQRFSTSGDFERWLDAGGCEWRFKRHLREG